MYLLFNTGLILHLCGISLMVGTTVAGFVTFRRVFAALNENEGGVTGLMKAAKAFSKWQALGGLFILLGGICMMIALQGLVMEQLWFKIKLVSLVLLVFNVPVTFRPGIARLHLFLSAGQANPSDMIKAGKLLNIFYFVQFLLILNIFILSVFRFN